MDLLSHLPHCLPSLNSNLNLAPLFQQLSLNQKTPLSGMPSTSSAPLAFTEHQSSTPISATLPPAANSSASVTVNPGPPLPHYASQLAPIFTAQVA
jgi:hypothetical protein